MAGALGGLVVELILTTLPASSFQLPARARQRAFQGNSGQINGMISDPAAHMIRFSGTPMRIKSEKR